MKNEEFEVIDAHVHLYPDAIADKVTSSLGAKFGNAPAFRANVEACRAHDAASGILASLNLPVATAVEQVSHTNMWAKAINDAAHESKRSAAPRVVSLAALHPDLENRAETLRTIHASGFAGVKFHPEYQGFRFNEARMDEVWEEMSALGLVAYLHAGGERVFKPPFHSSPTEILNLHRRFPKLRLVAAHLGGFAMWDEVEETLCGEDIWMDISHTFFWMDETQIVRIIKRHGTHRILFGSDAPWQDPARVLEAFLKVPFSDAERRQILSQNARELFALN